MNDTTKTVGTSDKMKAKDFITLGIFTVLFFAVVMICIFASAATVVCCHCCNLCFWQRNCRTPWRHYLYAHAC